MKILKAIFIVVSWIAWFIAMVLIFVLGTALDIVHFIVEQIYRALAKAIPFVMEDWTLKLFAYMDDEPLEEVKKEWEEWNGQ